MRPLRVINLLPDPRVGGPQIRVALVARALEAFDVQTTVIIPPGPAVAYFSDMGIRCVPFEFPRPRRHALALTALRSVLGLGWDVSRLARLIRIERADVVHTNGVLTLVGPLAARAAGVKSVWHLNDTQIPRLLYRTVIEGARRVHLYDRLIFSARAVAVHAGAPCAANDVVFPPVEMERFHHTREPADVSNVFQELKLAPDTPTVVTVGHVNAVKGHRDLVEAVHLLRERKVSVQAICVGAPVDRSEMRRLEELLVRRHVSDRVRFVGGTTRVERYLAAATVFVLPSRSEAMPMALIEAMAAGLPCIATDVGGVREAIENERTGLVVPPGAPSSLADAIESLLRAPELAAKMGNAAREAAVRFETNVVAARHAQIYRMVTLLNWSSGDTPEGLHDSG